MLRTKVAINESERLKDLDTYSILDTLPEDDFDNITAIASEICGTPVSLISLIDNKRQWFKSRVGLDVTETPKEYAFCAHAIENPDNIFMIEDAREDIRFCNNPLVTGDPHVIFYAGVPLVTDAGNPLGTLCVIDSEPKTLNESQVRSLHALANQVMKLLELRKNKRLLEETMKTLEGKNEELEKFAYVAAHDLKSPLNNIEGLVSVYLNKYNSKVTKKGAKLLKHISRSSQKLKSMIDGLLEYSKCKHVLNETASVIELKELMTDIVGLFSYENEVKFNLNSSLENVSTNKTAIEQILINLVANAIKYNDKEVAEIELSVSDMGTTYGFYVKDNGPGIESAYQGVIFKIFEVLDLKDKYGNSGNGIGLATVKQLVETLGGSISVESEVGKGATFMFTIAKAA